MRYPVHALALVAISLVPLIAGCDSVDTSAIEGSWKSLGAATASDYLFIDGARVEHYQYLESGSFQCYFVNDLRVGDVSDGTYEITISGDLAGTLTVSGDALVYGGKTYEPTTDTRANALDAAAACDG